MVNLSQTAIPISFEFYPPQTLKGLSNLKDTQKALMLGLKEVAGSINNSLVPDANIDFFSVTYGAGGTTREKTLAAVNQSKEHLPQIPIAPHITCVGATYQDIATLLETYQAKGITRLVALRGDLPSGIMGNGLADFKHAADLVRFIRAETGNSFHISVAAYPEMHPESKNLTTDIEYFAKKIEAGADVAITQFFFNSEAYLHFCDQVKKMGESIPIIPGIMPINHFTQLSRFSAQCGAEIPRFLQQAMEGASDDEQREIGLQVVGSLLRRLIQEGVPALHFYTMNKSSLALSLLKEAFS